MNKYIIPICDTEAWQIWNQVISAKNETECKDKLMNMLSRDFNFYPEGDYSEFVIQFDTELGILIGSIQDVELL